LDVPPAVCLEAVAGLAKIGGKEGRKALRNVATRARQGEVRKAAFEALGRQKSEGAGEKPAAGEVSSGASEKTANVPLRVTLHVKQDGESLFYQGQPISIQVGVIDERLHLKRPAKGEGDEEEEEITPFTVGTKDWPWFTGLSLQIERIVEAPEGETTREAVLENVDWKTRLVSPRPEGYVGNQPDYSALIAVFVLDPKTSQSLDPGQYVVKVTWKSTEPPADAMPIWHGQLEAEEGKITIAAAETPEEQGKLAYVCATYYMSNKDYEKAIAYALETERLFPSYQLYWCYNIAATAYDARGELGSALEYYRKFSNAHKDANPERFPYILQVREAIKRLESQLEQGEAGSAEGD
jgi:hypothetical protein